MAIPYSSQGGAMVRLDAGDAVAFNARWWLGKEDEQRFMDVVALYNHMRDTDQLRLEKNRHYARLYGGELYEPTGSSLVQQLTSPNRIQLNVIKSAVDSFVAKIGTQRAAPEPLTQGGNPSLRRKAKLLKRFLQAQFNLSDFYPQATMMVRDGCIFGTGILHPYIEDDGICIDRVHPSEVFVDPLEAMYGKPRQIIRKRFMARDILVEMFGEDKVEIIRDAGKTVVVSELDRAGVPYDPSSDQVLVLEAWRLPSSDKAKDGVHAIVLDSGELLWEPYTHTFLPFLFYKWSDDLDGFWGRGAVEEMNGIQVEINRLLTKIQSIFHLLAVPRIFVNAASKFQKAHFDNKIGAFIPYQGQPPIVHVAQSVHPEVFQHLDRLYSRAFEIVGVPQLGNRVQNPLSGDASGVALSTWHDIETERFKDKAQKLEKTILAASEHFIALAKDIGGDFAAPSARDRNTIDWIRWSEINLKEDEYYLQVFPVSSLPSTPAGRLQAVIAMLNAQLISPESGKKLLDYPDLEAEMALDRASSDLIDSVIEIMLDEGEYVPPEPFMDLQLALKKAQFWYNKALLDRVEDDRLQLLRFFMTETRKLMQAAMVEQQKLNMEAAGMNQPVNGAAPPAAGTEGAPPTAVSAQDGAMSA